MGYKKIFPLGVRPGLGSYDTFWPEKEIKTLEDALANSKQVIIIDFVKDEAGVIYFEAYDKNNPDEKKRMRLGWQHFPFGVDTRDDQDCIILATSLFKNKQQ